MTVGRQVARALTAACLTLWLLLGAVQAPAMAAPPSLTITQPSANGSTRDATTAFAGTTSDTLDAVTLAIYAGTDTQVSPVQTPLVIVHVGESWEASAASSLSDGQYTAVVEQTNGAETGSSSVTFTVDTAKPLVSLDPVTSPTNESSPTLTGSAGELPGDSSTVAVTIYDGGSVGGTVARSATVEVSGSRWQYKPEALADGTYTAQAVQQDAAGNVGESAPPVTFTVDTTAPVVSIEPVVSPTKDSTPALMGAAGELAGDAPSVSVTIYEGTGVTGSVVQSGTEPVSSASWSFTATKLADGTYTAQAVQKDQAGNTGKSEPPVTFTVDTQAPVVSLNSLPAWTKSSTPTFSGAAGALEVDRPSVDVTIYQGAKLVGSAKVAVSGAKWEYTPIALEDGTYTVQAAQEDTAGNMGTSAVETFTVDTTPPTISMAAPSNGAFLHLARPTFSGLAGHAVGDHQSVTLKIYAGASASGTPSETLPTVTPSGSKWTTGSTGPALSDGIYTAVAEQSDEAGNSGTSTVTFAIETNSPEVTLHMPGGLMRGSSFTTKPTPLFNGTGATGVEDAQSVILRLYSGTSAIGTPTRTLEAPLGGSGWSEQLTALPDGTYTAQAEQGDEDPLGQPGFSTPLTFTVDGDAPKVTLAAPADGSSTESSSELVGGSAGTAEGDSSSVTIQLFPGATTTGATPLEAITVQATGGTWSGTFGGLSPGTYTARAEQRDDVGNIGYSTPVSFTVTPPPPPPPSPPPVASFQWFPASPHVGEAVSLVSTSSDAGSPITAYAWSLLPGGALVAGQHVLGTSFATAGSHVVRLRVTDASGLSSEVSETITVASQPIILMQPFPVVRIAGSAKSSGVRIALFTVLAPVGARVSVTCHGHGCPPKTQSLVVAAKNKAKGGTVLVSFGRFERWLRAGAVLEVRIFKAGQIGKYTRFTVRRGKLPARVDTCLSSSGTKPMTCPSS